MLHGEGVRVTRGGCQCYMERVNSLLTNIVSFQTLCVCMTIV